MAMWRRVAKLESARSYFLRESGKLFYFPCRSYSNTMRTVVHLHNAITKAEIVLVGIDHVSPKSADFVRDVIRDFTPNVVAVELCKQRFKALLSRKTVKSMTWNDFFALKGSLRQKIIHFIINEVYAEFAARGLKPGEEMRVAIQEGLSLGAEVVCMDQDMNVTLKRIAQEFSLMEVIWVILRRKEIIRQYPLLYKTYTLGVHLVDAVNESKVREEACTVRDIDQLFDGIILPRVREEAIEFGEQYLPGLAKSLVHERDEYMVKKLRQMSGSVVGVVGALHLQGMHKLWEKAEIRPP